MPATPPRVILFDVDGTLIKVYHAGRRALEEAFALTFDRDDVAGHLDPVWFAGKTDLYIFRQVAINVGIPTWEYERRYSDLESRYLERLQRNVAGHPQKQLMPGVLELLDALEGIGGRESAAEGTSAGPNTGTQRADEGPSGPALGLMTGNLEAGARIKLAPWDLNRRFPSGGFGSDALDRHEIGQVARRRFERLLGAPVAPEEITLIGDTPADIEAARVCGFRVVAVGSGWSDEAELRAASPDAYLPDLSDLTAALRALLIGP